MVMRLKYWFYSKRLSEAVKPTKITDPDKHKYSGYGMGFDSRSEFLLSDGSMGKMLLFLELIWAHLCILIIRGKIS